MLYQKVKDNRKEGFVKKGDIHRLKPGGRWGGRKGLCRDYRGPGKITEPGVKSW